MFSPCEGYQSAAWRWGKDDHGAHAARATPSSTFFGVMTSYDDVMNKQKFLGIRRAVVARIGWDRQVVVGHLVGGGDKR